jgi:hypothetical protein
MRAKCPFYGDELLTWELLANAQPPVDHPLSTVRDCLFIIFAATLHA